MENGRGADSGLATLTGMTAETRPSTRSVHIRRTVSTVLSCATIAAATATLIMLFTTGAIANGTAGLGPIQAGLFNSRMLWMIPAVAAPLLLIGVPRPRSASERAPRMLAVIAAITVVVAVLLPAWFVYLQVAVIILGVALTSLGSL